MTFIQASSHLKGQVPKSYGMLIYHIATKIKPQISAHVGLLTRYVVEEKIDSEMRLTGIYLSLKF